MSVEPIWILIARSHLALVDALAVDQRPRLVAEVDQRDVRRGRHLDDRVHTRGEIVIHPEVAARILADLDDVLRNRVSPYELIPLVQRERERDFGLALTVHRLPYLRCSRPT